MKALLRTLTLAGLLLGNLLVSPAAASADPITLAPGDAITQDPVGVQSDPSSETVPLLPVDKNGALDLSLQAGICPTCQCTLTVDNPHQSGTNPKAVNVHSRVNCQKAQPRIRATADLYRSGFWQWEKVASRGDVTTQGKNYAKTNAASWDGKCVSGDYKGVGSGYVDLSNGTKLGGTNDTFNTVKCR